MPYKHFIPVHAVSALGCFVATLSLNQRPLSGCYNPRAMEPKRTPSPPTTTTTGVVILGKYQLGRLLGRGSFAKVYHGRSLSDNTTVAIKVIDKAKTVTAAMEPHIVREVAAMRRLNNHPNILKIHEVLATKTKIYLVMELAQGGELFAHLARRGRLTEPAARRYFRQLVSALRFCHQNGVAHRDIKPQNILLDEAGNLKVSDFGLSALPEQLRNGMLHTACGTPAYTAPEVFTRKGYDGAKADAWSCGVLLFVFLAGYLPFDDSNIPNMYKKIRRREFQLPASISKPAKHVINRLLDPNPDTRMSIEALMGHSWFKKSSEKESNHCSSLDLDTITAKDCNYTITMNAFDIISMSSGLDLSGLFEGSVNKRGKRFTSKASVELIEERMREVGERLGYRVERGKGGTIGFLKEKWAVLSAKMLEVTEELVLVEVKVIDGWAELEELHWDELRAGLEDIVVSWHSDGFGEEAQLEL